MFSKRVLAPGKRAGVTGTEGKRFSGYRDKRRGEANGHADAFDGGPSVFGHQNRQRAERQAARHDRHRGRALSQWSKAEQRQERTAGVIRHALHKSSASVRRGRILRIEADQRRHEKEKAQAVTRWKAWQKVAAEPDVEKAYRWACALSIII